MQITSPSKADVARLTAFLADPLRPGGTFTYHDLRGFLFSIATAPVLVRPSEWIPAIFDGKEAGYRNLAEARTITGALMGCYNQTVQAARHADHIQPADVGMDTSSDDALRLWARGFITGFEYLGDEWDAVVEKLDDPEHEDFLAAYLDLTVWVDPKRCQMEYEIDDAALAEILDSCREALPDSLATVADYGITAYEEELEARRAPAPVRSGKVVGRNDPCPCGSGKKYKKCCGVN